MQENTKNKERVKESQADTSISQYRQLHLNLVVRCINCGSVVDKKYELCPHCGYRLHNNHCTYCGAEMSGDDLFCGECGGNSKGVSCPQCGTLSFRSFCPKCNAPVDELGTEEMKRAKSDPIYKRICALAQQIIEAQDSAAHEGNVESQMPPEILALLDRYRQMQTAGDVRPAEVAATEREEMPDEVISPDNGGGITLTVSTGNSMDLTSAIDELNALMKSQIPEPGLTLQMQRNYYSARKVAVYHRSTIKECVGWVCNLCGFQHRSPSECAQPELGGTWIYRDKEITTKTYE